MALTVRTNLSAMSAYNSLDSTSSRLTGGLDRISSGLRVTQGADDAAGLGATTKLNARSSSLEQAMRDANDGISMIQTAEGATHEVQNILVRMRELAVQASSETVSEAERAYLHDEFSQLRGEIGRIASVTEFGGTPLTDGSNPGGGDTAQVGIDGASTSRLDLSFGDLRPAGLGVDTLSLETSGGVEAAITALDGAIDQVDGYRSSYGSVQSRLESSLANSATYLESLRRGESRIMDADFARSSAEMTKHQIMQQAGVAALAQAKNVNQAALSLLQARRP